MKNPGERERERLSKEIKAHAKPGPSHLHVAEHVVNGVSAFCFLTLRAERLLLSNVCHNKVVLKDWY